MKYCNPIIPGFYPDPSICEAEGKYYLAASSFQYFPGVPLFESEDLINWKQIGHVLTRPTQVQLGHVPSSGGVFAPTIRYHKGRFYMVTTNDTTHENFYVYTDNIYGEWSDPITIDQGGIDPSLLFDEDKVYFISNGEDENGVKGVAQCEIDIATGEKLTPSRCIWQGTGGRYLEAPHVYHIGDWYYLLAAEGGTEYGHMEVCARGKTAWGPFTNCPYNPILTNRNRAPYIVQGIGHGDLVQAPDGEWFMVTLGYRQIHIWQQYHHLGREVFLTPVRFGGDGWIYCGVDGTVDLEYEINAEKPQTFKTNYTFENTDWGIDWCGMRKPDWTKYDLAEDHIVLRGSEETIDQAGSPTFMALRQRAFEMDLRVHADCRGGEGGVTVYSCELDHYDLAVRKGENGFEAVLKLNLGGIKHTQCVLPLKDGKAELLIKADNLHYEFYVRCDGKTEKLGEALTKYVSTEVSGGFTGVVLGLYAQGEGETRFAALNIDYEM